MLLPFLSTTNCGEKNKDPSPSITAPFVEEKSAQRLLSLQSASFCFYHPADALQEPRLPFERTNRKGGQISHNSSIHFILTQLLIWTRIY